MVDAASELHLLWPSDNADDAIRRQLACILAQDPDHRLRLAHVEPLLHLALAPALPCSSGRLQALLTDPATARVFPVDWRTQVADWRSRVVHLDAGHLSHELAAAKHRAATGAGLAQAGGAAADQHLLRLGDSTEQQQQEHHQQQQQHAPASSVGGISQQQQQQRGLDTIFGSAPPAFGAGAGHAQDGHAAGSAQPPSSLFGSSFEVPHAIASCWAVENASSCGSGAVHVRPPHQDAAAPLEGCGGSSSFASGSSNRSLHTLSGAQLMGPCNAAPGAAAADAPAAATSIPGARVGSASRLRNTNDDPGAGEPAPANSIDVCTPRSTGGAGGGAGGIRGDPGAGRGGMSEASPLNSGGEGEEEAEYSEAALVFGSVHAAGGPGPGLAAAAAAAAASEQGARSGGAGEAEGPGAGGAQAAASGDAARAAPSEGPPSVQGVDWACLAALQQQHQQQQSLLFGLDDLHTDAPTPRGSSGDGRSAAALSAAATGALTARRMLMEQQAASFGDGSQGGIAGLLLGHHQQQQHLAALAGSLGGMVPGSAPAALQHQQEQLLLAAAAAAAAAGGASAGSGFGSGGGQQLGEGGSLFMSNPEGFAAAFSMPGSNYSGSWGTSPAMQQHFMQQRQQQHAAAAAMVAAAAAAHSQQLQQQHSLLSSLGGPEGSIDVGFRSDQLMREPSMAGSGGGDATPGKGGGSFLHHSSSLGAGSSYEAAGPQELAGAERSNSGPVPRLTGWASVAAREPAGSGADGAAGALQPQGSIDGAQHQAAGSGDGRAVHKLPPRVRGEVQALINSFGGVLKVEDFDDGVVHQLNAKRSEEEAVAAVRHIAHYDLGTIQHMAAYLNHLVKHYNHNAAAAAAAADAATGGALSSLGSALAAAAAVAGSARGDASAAAAVSMQQLLAQGLLAGGSAGGGCGSLGSSLGCGRGGMAGGGGVAGSGGAGSLGAFGGQIRLASVPVSTKAMLQKLPLKVFKAVEGLVGASPYLEWRHFDAGVIKVLAQLSKLCEGDVFEELELLSATDLSNVEYMPAYLNKRLNNRLWSRRKADGHVPAG